MPIGPTTRPGADDPSPRDTVRDPIASPSSTPSSPPADAAALNPPSDDPPATARPGPQVETLPARSDTGPARPVEQPGRAASATSPDGDRKDRGRGGPLSFLRELPVLLIVAFLLALLIKSFLVQAFYIPSGSMENTLMVGDRVLVNKLVYHLHHPRRGDIVVFADPHPLVTPHRNPFSALWHWLTEGLGVSSDPQKDFIKRVVGLPGERIEVRQGVVLVNGTRLREPYLNPFKDLSNYGPVRVPRDHLFVMGDNRANSRDSRTTLGFIPYDKVIGRAFVVIWPPSRMRWLHGT